MLDSRLQYSRSCITTRICIVIMGNKFSRRRAVVDERYTRTQGLYQHRDVDPRKLRRLILNGQLAPCFPGAEDYAVELDECPICFLFYPSLNRSKCCTKGICTECFLQIKSPHSARPTQCPFCKTSSYVVEYRGAKTVEEKGVEQAEEQKVIEAKIRIRQKELHEEEERMLRREEDQGQDNNVPDRFRRNFSNLHGFTLPTDDVEGQEMVSTGEQDLHGMAGSNSALQPVQACQIENISEQVSALQTRGEPVAEAGALISGHVGRLRGSSFQRLNRGDDFDLDLEEIMVMEAIWLSIQEQGQAHQEQHQVLGMSHNSRTSMNEIHNDETVTQVQEPCETRTLPGRNTLMGGLAGAIAALAERQATTAETIDGNPSNDQVSNQHVEESGGNLVSAISNEMGAPLIVNNASRLMSPHLTGADAEAEQGQIEEKCHAEEVRSQAENGGGQELNNWIEVSIDSGRAISPLVRGESRGSMSDWIQDHSSEAVEVGTSFASSVPSASDLPWEGSDFVAPPSTECIDEPPVSAQPIAVLPDSFEEQMMLAMALSLAEAQAQAWRR